MPAQAAKASRKLTFLLPRQRHTSNNLSYQLISVAEAAYIGVATGAQLAATASVFDLVDTVVVPGAKLEEWYCCPHFAIVSKIGRASCRERVSRLV